MTARSHARVSGSARSTRAAQQRLSCATPPLPPPLAAGAGSSVPLAGANGTAGSTKRCFDRYSSAAGARSCMCGSGGMCGRRCQHVWTQMHMKDLSSEVLPSTGRMYGCMAVQVWLRYAAAHPRAQAVGQRMVLGGLRRCAGFDGTLPAAAHASLPTHHRPVAPCSPRRAPLGTPRAAPAARRARRAASPGTRAPAAPPR
eukprot:356353-Chlamydomonas_euryale.AAC.1